MTMYESNVGGAAITSPRLHWRGDRLPDELERLVADIVARLEERLLHQSYRSLQDEIERGRWDPPPAPSGEPITLIPGDGKAACTQAALAICSGTSARGRLGFPSVMRSVREYLIDCERIARVAIVVTDVWSPKHLDEHLRDVWAHHRQGRFVVPFLVAGGRLNRLGWPQP
jgi:hypothetical protein